MTEHACDNCSGIDPASCINAPVPVGQLRPRLAAKLREVIDRQLIGEWICCDPVNWKHKLCRHGDDARQALVPVLADDPEWPPSRLVVDALLAELSPVLEQLRAEIDIERKRGDGLFRQLKQSFVIQRRLRTAWWSARVGRATERADHHDALRDFWAANQAKLEWEGRALLAEATVEKLREDVRTARLGWSDIDIDNTNLIVGHEGERMKWAALTKQLYAAWWSARIGRARERQRRTVIDIEYSQARNAFLTTVSIGQEQIYALQAEMARLDAELEARTTTVAQLRAVLRDVTGERDQLLAVLTELAPAQPSSLDQGTPKPSTSLDQGTGETP